ncbi:MAG: 4-hydroxythreonine-4-phosphate dehydrogenase PdxA [Gammaproteobacteria bacterium]|nr:4-hydroxythreonine-4-phosphate dehydrogenase PdxA [Gammaproteobacteria bacterium]
MPPLPLAYTAGEPAGIGPDLIIQLCQQAPLTDVVVIADPALLQQRAKALNLPLTTLPQDQPPSRCGELRVKPYPLATPVTPGKLDTANCDYLLSTLNAAVSGCLDREFSAMVTGPIHKGIINEAGIPFSGHTEYLAKRCAREDVVMMLTAPLPGSGGRELRVPLVTTHLPLAEVPAAITPQKLEKTITIVAQALRDLYHLPNPVIAICGLNPHAGEESHLGTEERDIIEPTLDRLRKEGHQLIGPLPADTAFTPKQILSSDATIALYHDQGLPVLKYIGFGNGINITLGLPILRTSVDHGTALQLAATGLSSCGSLSAALNAARHFVTGK